MKPEGTSRMEILIVYRTQYGSTKRCAELIRDGVGEDVTLVDLRDTPRPAVDDFDVVLIGGSIYGGLIQREVVAFCGRNRDRLLARKVGLFICCLYREERAMEQLESAFPGWLRDRAFAKYPLGGALEPEKLRPMDRFLVERLGEFTESRGLIRYDRIEELCGVLRRLRETRADDIG